VLAGLDSRGRRAFTYPVSKSLDVYRGHCCDLQCAEERFDVPFDATPVTIQSASLLRRLPASQDPADLAALRIIVAEFVDRRSLAGLLLRSRRIAALRDLAEESPSLISGHFGRPGCAVSADRRPALATIYRPIFDDVGDKQRPSADEPQSPLPLPCPRPMRSSVAEWRL
jgi:hypothetical protein